MSKKIIKTVALLLIALFFSSGCVLKASNTDTTVTQNIEIMQTTKEPTETATVTTPTTTPEVLEAVVMLPVPATYASLFDGTKIYSDGSRTVVLKTLVKGDQVTITGTSGQYGVTAEGSFVNLHLMSVVVTLTPTPAETTAVPTDPTAATTKAPAATTKATTATTKAPVATTKATTAATTQATTVATTAAPAYAENCDNIKSLIIAKLQAKGLWFPDAEVKGDDLIQLSVGYANSDDQYATAYVNGKFGQTTSIGATSVSVWIESGYLNMSSTACYLPVA